MKKTLVFILTVVLALALIACSAQVPSTPGSSGNDVSAPSSSGNDVSAPSSSDVASSAPATGDGPKIAVLRNMQNSDHTAQFFAGCTDEGKALGYTVDTFMSDQDDVKMQNLMEQALGKDYDIWIVSHANEGYQYDIVSRAVEKGISVVCFDCGGEHVPGVTYTSQNDIELAKLSLDGMIEACKAKGATEPIKFAEINILGLIVPFDTRHSVIEDYEKQGKIECVEILSPDLTGDTYTQIYTSMTNVLNKNSGVMGVWGASSSLLDGAVAAINDAGRQNDLIATAIDISNTELARMVAQPFYYCCAAVDPYVIGVVDVRLAVLKQLGVETPETYVLEPINIYGKQVTDKDTMQTLGNTFPEFGKTDAYNTDEIKALREKNQK